MHIEPDNHIKLLKAAESIVIAHTNFGLALERLKMAHTMAEAGADPRRLLLVGEAGCGKTLLGRYFQSLFPPQEIDGGRTKPVLYIETPAAPTLKAFAEQMLIALGDPAAHRGSANEKQVRALELMQALGVMFIVVDEFQHFLDHGRGSSLSTVGDWFKLLIDKTGVPCLLMGLPRCAAILQANDQIRRRFSAKLVLPAFSLDTTEDEQEFYAVLQAIDHQLPIKLHPDFLQSDATQRIFFATDGRIAYVKKLFVSALQIALFNGASYLDQQILSDAFSEEIWSEGGTKLNPFGKSFVFRCLNRSGEPFYLPVAGAKKRDDKGADE